MGNPGQVHWKRVRAASALQPSMGIKRLGVQDGAGIPNIAQQHEPPDSGVCEEQHPMASSDSAAGVHNSKETETAVPERDDAQCDCDWGQGESGNEQNTSGSQGVKAVSDAVREHSTNQLIHSVEGMPLISNLCIYH